MWIQVVQMTPKITFITTPAVMIAIRDPTDLLWKARGSREAIVASPGSSPSIFTNPPKGSALTQYSVSPYFSMISARAASSPAASTCAVYCRTVEPRRRPNPLRQETSVGPNPSENISTFTPAHLAKRKWPSSWTKITKPIPRITRATAQTLASALPGSL